MLIAIFAGQSPMLVIQRWQVLLAISIYALTGGLQLKIGVISTNPKFDLQWWFLRYPDVPNNVRGLG